MKKTRKNLPVQRFLLHNLIITNSLLKQKRGTKFNNTIALRENFKS